jgi:hypothetical protein
MPGRTVPTATPRVSRLQSDAHPARILDPVHEPVALNDDCAFPGTWSAARRTFTRIRAFVDWPCRAHPLGGIVSHTPSGRHHKIKT